MRQDRAIAEAALRWAFGSNSQSGRRSIHAGQRVLFDGIDPSGHMQDNIVAIKHRN